MDLGPQHKGDTPFVARMRLHQSWYRAAVLRVDYGKGPTKGPKAAPLGSMLDDQGAANGTNFLTPEIRSVYRDHDKTGVEPFRCERNMLSSQPMCFNIFGPLLADRALAEVLMRALVPSPVDNVREVEIEHAPAARYLDDKTAFDGFISYERVGGGRGFVAIETKLTEPFSPKNPDADAYVELTTKFGDTWPEDAHAALGDPRWFQVWRNHLLAHELLADPKAGFDEGYSAVVRHPMDSECAAAVGSYQQLLTESGRASFLDLPLDRVIDAWRPLVAQQPARRTWLDAFHARYLALDLSAAWHRQA
jgi:hypothetical protein